MSDTTSKEQGDVSSLSSDDATLATLGYKSEFKREFNMLSVVCFAFTIMGVCASVSSTLTFGLLSGGHVGMVWGWFIPSIFVLGIASVLAELASSMPTSAGLYFWSHRLSHPDWAPLVSWMCGWSNVTGQITLVCSIDFVCAQMITSAIQVGNGTVVSLGGTYGIFLAILVAHGFVASMATRLLSRLTVLYALINLGTTIALLIALPAAKKDRVSAMVAFTQFDNFTGWTSNGFAFLLAFTSPMWTLTGYDSAAHISEESKNPSLAAPVGIMTAVFSTASLGWLLLIVFSFCSTDLNGLVTSPLPLSAASLILDVLGPNGMLAIWSFVIITQFFTGAAQTVDSSRSIFAFSRDNALPGSRFWKRMNSKTQTPVNAVWLTVALSALCGLLGFSIAALTALDGLAVIGLYISYIIPIICRMLPSGQRQFKPGPFNLGGFSRMIAFISTLWVSFVVIILLFPGGLSPNVQSMNWAIIILAAVILFSGGWWIIDAHKWFKGPVHTIRDAEATLAEQKMKLDDGSGSGSGGSIPEKL